MTHTTLFSLGVPFGQWPAVAKSFLDERLLDPAIATWHQEVVGAPLTDEVNGSGFLEALAEVKIDRVMLERLQASRPFQSPCWGGADVRLSWTGHAVAQLPHARFLIWVEHPARALAHWLPTVDGAVVPEALAVIESSVRCMVDLIHKHRTRCLAVCVDEAIAFPDAVAQRLKDWLGVETNRTLVSALPVPDPLYLLLSEQLVASSSRLLRDYERLYASCTAIVESEEVPALRSTPLALEAIKTQARSRAELTKTQSDRDLLANQLHQAQEKLQSALLKQWQDQARVDAQQAKNDAAKMKALSDSEAQLGAKLNRQKQEYDLLLVQLHQVQEEIEHYYRAYRDLETVQNRRVASPMVNKITNKVASVDIGTERDTPPHRELSLLIRDLQVDQKKIERLQVRLVEHHGRVGLALVQPRGEPAPLAVWEPSGTEGAASFVLLIPTDDNGRQRLQRMGASDWRIVESTVRNIERGLDQKTSGGQLGRWANVAQRLIQQLVDLPARFRFDQVDAIPDPQVAGAFIASFGNVCFGSHHLPKVQIRWRPQADEGGSALVELLRPADGAVVLPASWPVDADGVWLAAWSVPLFGASQAAVWRGMSRTEREFLFGLLDALPAAASAATRPSQGSTAGHAGELVAAAALPLKAAYRLFHGGRLRRVAQAARGRLAA